MYTNRLEDASFTTTFALYLAFSTFDSTTAYNSTIAFVVITATSNTVYNVISTVICTFLTKLGKYKQMCYLIFNKRILIK